MKEKYALITGASSGLGVQFAHQLAEKGYQLILVARREDRLIALSKEIEETYHKKAVVLKADLAILDECIRVYEETKQYDISIVINNAGFGDCGLFSETDLKRDLSMIDVNIKSLHVFSKLFVQRFFNQKEGMLLNVASSAGLYPAGPYMSTYYASKSYVTSLTSAIHQELKERGEKSIHVCALCPGPVDTEFNDVANVKFALSGISAEYCVRIALKGLFKNKAIIIPSLKMKLATIPGNRLLPRRLMINMVGKQQKKKFQK